MLSGDAECGPGRALQMAAAVWLIDHKGAAEVESWLHTWANKHKREKKGGWQRIYSGTKDGLCSPQTRHEALAM